MLGRANVEVVPRWRTWPPARALERERTMAEFYERPAARNLPIGSDIDPQYPVFGNPLTATVRNNFAAAKDEIEDLQRRVSDLEVGLSIDGGVF